MRLYYKLIFLWVFISACGAHADWQRSYDMTIPMPSSDLYKIKQNDKWGIADSTGQVLLATEYDLIGDFEDSLSRLYKNMELGAMNWQGNLIAPVGRYDFIWPLSNGLLRVVKDNKQGIINLQGEIIEPLIYDKIYLVRETNDLLILLGPKHSGVRNTQGQYIIPPVYDSIYWERGLFYVKQNNKIGLFNEQYEQVLPFKYSYINLYSHEIVLNGKYGYIDDNYHERIAPIYDDIIYLDSYDMKSLKDDELMAYWFKYASKWGFMYKNKVLVSPSYDEVKVFQRSNDRFIDDYTNEDAEDYTYYEVKKGDNVGWLDSLGRVLVPCLYDEIKFTYSKDVFVAIKDDLAGLVKKGGEVLIKSSVQCSYIDELHAGWARAAILVSSPHVFEYWFVNTKGETKHFDQYDNVGSFSDKGFAFAIQGDKLGIIDTSGSVILPFIYEAADLNPYNGSVHDYFRGTYETGYQLNFINGLMVVSLNGKKGLINAKGQTVLEPKYDDIQIHYRDSYSADYSFDFCETTLGKYKGILNKYGKLIASPKYDNIEALDNGLYKVSLNSKIGTLNKQGRVITPLQYDYIRDIGDEIYMVSVNRKVGLLNNHYKVIVPPLYDDVEILENGLYRLSLNSKRGLLNSQGKLVVPILYSDVKPTDCEDVFKVRLKSKLGLVNKNGQQIVPLKYDDIKVIKSGVALVKLASKWGILDKQGHLIAPLQYDDIEVVGDVYIIHQKERLGVLNAQGQLIVPAEYHSIEVLSNAYFKVRKDFKNGICNQQGKILIPLRYDDISLLTNGDYLVQLWGRYALIDKHFKVIIPWGYKAITLLDNGHYQTRM